MENDRSRRRRLRRRPVGSTCEFDNVICKIKVVDIKE